MDGRIPKTLRDRAKMEVKQTCRFSKAYYNMTTEASICQEL